MRNTKQYHSKSNPGKLGLFSGMKGGLTFEKSH